MIKNYLIKINFLILHSVWISISLQFGSTYGRFRVSFQIQLKPYYLKLRRAEERCITSLKPFIMGSTFEAVNLLLKVKFRSWNLLILFFKLTLVEESSQQPTESTESVRMKKGFNSEIISGFKSHFVNLQIIMENCVVRASSVVFG